MTASAAEQDALLDLFDELLALNEPGRVQRLALLDASIAAMLRAMLVADARAGNALPEVPFASMAGSWDGLEPGQVLGSFELRRLVGRGGMGQVYLGQRLGDVQQLAAIKVQLPLVATDETLRRFRLERQMLAGLEHPAIARLIECGEDAQGRPYYAMEWIDGVSIDRYCDDNRLDLRSRLQLFVQLCDGVDYAHRHLVVHRDIKTSNIMVTTEGQPKLLDFGIAKALDAPTAAMESTATHARFFSPHHAAPEQVRGEAITIGCDVYALGVLLYQLLSGLRPYELEGLSPREVEERICEWAPAAASERLMALQRSDRNGADYFARQRGNARSGALIQALRGDLDRIVLHALRKRPEERYASAAELRADIKRYLAGEAVLARGMGRGYRMRKFVGRHRVATALAVGFVIALSVFTLVLGFQAAALRNERDEVARQLLRVDQERRHAEQVTGFIEQTFALADPNLTLGRKLTVNDVLDTAVRTIDYTRVDAPELKHRMQMSLVKVMMSLGRYADAIAVMRTTPEGLPMSARLERQRMQAETAIAAGEDQSARDASAQALKLLEQWDRADAESSINTWLTRARALRASQPEQALAAANLALEKLKLQDQPNVELGTPASRLRARLLMVLDRSDEGIAELEALLRLQRSNLPKHHPALLETLRLLAGEATRRGDLPVAMRYVEEQLASAEQVFGADSLRVVYALNSRGNLRTEAGEAAAAIADFSRCIELLTAKVGADHPHVAQTLYNRGEVLRLLSGDAKAAEHDYRRAIAVAQARTGPDPLGQPLFRLGLGSALLDQGFMVEAESEIDKAVAAGARQSQHGLFYGLALGERALLDWRRGQTDDARQHWAEAAPLLAAYAAESNPARGRLERALSHLASNPMQHASRPSHPVSRKTQ